MEQVDFAGPYYYASIVCVAKDGSPQASAKGISELTGTATAQIETIWYDTCLPQIKGAEIQTAAETAPAMLMALETGAVEFICTDIPTAKGAVAAYDDMVILDFTDTEDNFQVDEGDINIGISLKKGNTELKDAINGLGLGAAGTGGDTVCLALKMERAHTHTAIAPVAINFHCWVARRAGIRIYDDGRVEKLL